MVPWEKLQSFINNDPFIQQVKQDLAVGNSVPKGYSLRQNILYYKDIIVLPSTRNITDMFLKQYHDSLRGGHAGDMKTYQRLAAEWFWPGMQKSVISYV